MVEREMTWSFGNARHKSPHHSLSSLTLLLSVVVSLSPAHPEHYIKRCFVVPPEEPDLFVLINQMVISIF
jgi:hypothetical protein